MTDTENNSIAGIRRVDDMLKIFLGVCLTGMFAVLGWLAVTVSETNLTIVEVSGKIELLNAKMGYMQKDLGRQPRREELVLTNSKLDMLETRVGGLEVWIQRYNIAPPHPSQ